MRYQLYLSAFNISETIGLLGYWLQHSNCILTAFSTTVDSELPLYQWTVGLLGYWLVCHSNHLYQWRLRSVIDSESTVTLNWNYWVSQDISIISTESSASYFWRRPCQGIIYTLHTHTDRTINLRSHQTIGLCGL